MIADLTKYKALVFVIVFAPLVSCSISLKKEGKKQHKTIESSDTSIVDLSNNEDYSEEDSHYQQEKIKFVANKLGLDDGEWEKELSAIKKLEAENEYLVVLTRITEEDVDKTTYNSILYVWNDELKDITKQMSKPWIITVTDAVFPQKLDVMNTMFQLTPTIFAYEVVLENSNLSRVSSYSSSTTSLFVDTADDIVLVLDNFTTSSNSTFYDESVMESDNTTKTVTLKPITKLDNSLFPDILVEEKIREEYRYIEADESAYTESVEMGTLRFRNGKYE